MTNKTNFEIPYVQPIIQGDVILKLVDYLPPGAVLQPEGAVILQQSETTGNYHQFSTEAKVDLYTIPVEAIPGIATITDNKGKVIVVHEPSYLFHGKVAGDHRPVLRTGDGHDSILVQPGTYVVDIVREYDYEYHSTSRVVD